MFDLVDTRHVRVFLTYTYDNKQHMKNVLHVCDWLKKNNFSVGLDARESSVLRKDAERARWHNMRYDKVVSFSFLLKLSRYHNVCLQFEQDPINPLIAALKQQRCGHLDFPRVKLASFGGRSFAYAGPSNWNSLPAYLRDSSLSLSSFKHHLKIFLFSFY